MCTKNVKDKRHQTCWLQQMWRARCGKGRKVESVWAAEVNGNEGWQIKGSNLIYDKCSNNWT